MDRVNQLRGGGAGGSRDSSLDGSGANDSFLTANDSSKYFSLSEDSFDITKDVSLASTSSETPLNDSDCFPNLSPIGKKDLLDYKIGKQIEAANILSGGVNIFEDNENSYDGNELVIDDNVEIDKSPNLKSPDTSLPFQDDNVETENASTSKSLENSALGLNVETEDNSLEGSQANVAIEQSSRSPEAAEPLDTDKQLLKNLEAADVAPSLEEVHADLPINKHLEDVPVDNGVADVAEIHLPMDNGVADIAHVPENGVADVAEIALPLEEAEIGEANLPNDIGEANLPNDNVEENADNAAEENDDRTEVVLQIDGNNVAAINIGTGLYLYRKEGQEELAAVQIVEGEESSFKFLKVRENAEGNLEVYEEIQEVVVVPQEMPVREVIPVAAVNVTASTSGDNNRPVACEPSTSREVENKDNTPDKDPAVPSTSKQDNEPNKDHNESKNERNVNGKMVKISESRKSPLMAYHSTPNKEGIPLTKTMVDQQLHPIRHSDNIKKTIEVHTDNCKQKTLETPSTSKCKDYVSPDKKFDTVDKPIDRESSIKTQMNTVSKEEEVIEKKTDEVACSSYTGASKVEGAKRNEDDVTAEVKEKDMVRIVSKEEKKNRDEPEYKFKKSIEIPSTSSCIEKSATGISKEEQSNLTPKRHVATINTDVKALQISISSPLIIAPMVIRNTVAKILEIGNGNEKPVVTPNEIIESDDMEVDEDVLVIEEQIIESQSQSDEIKKGEEESAALVVEKKSKIIEDQIKSVLGTGEAKPTSSAKNSISIVGNPDISKSSKIDTTTANYVTDINVKINSDKPGEENKFKTGIINSSFNKEHSKGTSCKDTQLNDNIKAVGNNLTQESTIPKESLVHKIEQAKLKESTEIKPIATNSTELKANAVESIIPTTKVNHTANSTHNKPEKIISKLESTNKYIEKKALFFKNTKDIINSTPIKEQQQAGLPSGTFNLIKPHVKSDVKPIVTNAAETKKEVNCKLPFTAVDTKLKSINNNHAPVPFGQWTEANRQDFLNKIKESKPVNISNANQIKQPNDLNRRDVLKKIDSQRQTYNANAKIQESLNKGIVKTEAFASKNVPATITKRDTKVPVKSEAPVVKPTQVMEKQLTQEPTQQLSAEDTVATSATVSSTTKKEQQRKEINNQDIIDKTVEGIINRAVTGKSTDDVKQAVTEKPIIEKVDKKPEQTTNSQPTLLDAIEMKMNELHGIPFVERPPHELPRPYITESKVSSKTDTHNIPQKVSKIPNLLPLTKSQQKLKDCEDDIMNVDTPREKSSISSLDLSKSIEKSLAKTTTSAESNVSKDKIITEKDFDKFARRNSVTYENCLAVTDSHQVIQTVVPREAPPKKISRNEQMLAEAKAKSPHKHIPIKQYHPSKAAKYVPGPDSKQYQSKLQLAYQTAITAKRRIDSPITIIEDKPVKVVYLDSNVSEFTSSLNVQGRDLSPVKRPLEPDAVTVGTCDSLDSDTLDGIDDTRQDEVKIKNKHQRKQVLTPVETPDLELIEPGDLGIEVSPKKKRKTEDRSERKQNLVPKKSYLLGRSITPADVDVPRENRPSPAPVVHNDVVSAIDNLVKAAELLENQSENMNASVQSADSPQNTPVKRGRGRPRKNPPPDSAADITVSPQKKPRLIDAKPKHISSSDEDSSDDDSMIKENWTMGKINEKIVCPICKKLFRSENVVFKHVKHCTGPSPSRSESDKRSSRRSRLSRESETKSRESGTKSRGSRSNDPDEVDYSPVRKTPRKRKSKDSGKSSSSDEVIPVEPEYKESEKDDLPAKNELRKTVKPTLNPRTNNLVCEICGKSFRQLSYLVSHKLQHKKEYHKKANDPQATEKSVFSCETCKKQFRKLHHLVQHRLIHNPVQLRALRKTSSEQKELPKGQDAKMEDQSAGFRCEPCDKSFRKLHHLVEHRETHDGINRQRSNSITQVPEKEKPTPPPQCDICKKTFRKLHHLIEHKEQHLETSSEKSDDQKSVKSSLSTKDIIHECNLCYMVFPNEHSLNKHTVICLRKKKQSAAKQAAALEDKSTEDADAKEESKIEAVKEAEAVETKVVEILEKPPEKSIDPPKAEVLAVDAPTPEPIQHDEKVEKPELKEVVEKKPPTIEVPILKVVKPAETPVKKLVEEIIVIEDTPVKKKAPVKDKVAPTLTKRQKGAPPTECTAPSSDEDEVRYMFNPDFKATAETSESKTFTKIRSKKRNSLQFERPQKYEARIRSLFLQPPKVARLRAKSDDLAASPKPAVKPKEVPSTDSDDSDVKYSFPPAPVKPEKQTAPEAEPKRRKTMAEKQVITETTAMRRKTITEKQEVTETAAPRRKTITEKQEVTETAAPRRKTITEKQEVTETAAPRRKTVTEKQEVTEPAATRRKTITEKQVVTETAAKRRKTITEKQEVTETAAKRRKSMAEKRKSLSGIAKRKSLGKAIVNAAANPAAAKPIKRRTAAAEHRCDCGQLFSSAALLARHASLAHTPPRVRRPRDADALNTSVRATNKSVNSTRKSVAATDTAGKQNRKSSVETRKSVASKDNRDSAEQKKSVGSKDSLKSSAENKGVATVGGKNSARKTAKTPSARSRVHTGVPLPEKRASRK